jgi:hypothetical protein
MLRGDVRRLRTSGVGCAERAVDLHRHDTAFVVEMAVWLRLGWDDGVEVVGKGPLRLIDRRAGERVDRRVTDRYELLNLGRRRAKCLPERVYNAFIFSSISTRPGPVKKTMRPICLRTQKPFASSARSCPGR